MQIFASYRVKTIKCQGTVLNCVSDDAQIPGADVHLLILQEL